MDFTAFSGYLIFAGLALVAVGFYGFGWVLYKAGSLTQPGPVIVSLSMLTLVALLGGILSERPEVLTLAATGLGALAGALSTLYQNKDKKEEDSDA